MSDTPAPGGSGDELKQEGVRRFKKLTLQFVVSKLTDDRLEAELNELNEKQLLPNYFNLNETFTHAKLDGVHTTFLHLAADNGRGRIVQWLLDNKADPNTRNSKNETALHIAVTHAKKKAGRDIVAAMLAAGGRLEETDGEGRSVTAVAEAAGVDMAKILHKEEEETKSAPANDATAGEVKSSTTTQSAEQSTPATAASPNVADDAKSLIKKIRLGKIKLGVIAKTLIPASQPDCTQETRERLEASVLEQLSDAKNFELVRPALEQAVLDGDRTLLHLAAECGCPLLTHALLKLGLDPNKQDSNGYTALHACTTSPHFEMPVAQLLLADSRTNVGIKSYMKQETAFVAAGDKPYAAELQAIEVNKNFKMQVLRMLAQINEKRKPLPDLVKRVLELKNNYDAGNAAAAASTTAAGASVGGQPQSSPTAEGGPPRGLLERLSRKSSAAGPRKSEVLPYGRPAPAAEFGTLVSLGPAKNAKYGADYRPPSPQGMSGARSSMSGRQGRTIRGRPGSGGSNIPPPINTAQTPSTASVRMTSKPAMPGTPTVFGHKRTITAVPGTPAAGALASSPMPTSLDISAGTGSVKTSRGSGGPPVSFRERMALRQAAVAKGESSNLAAINRRRSAGSDNDDAATATEQAEHGQLDDVQGHTAEGLSFAEARQKKMTEVSQSSTALSTALLNMAGPGVKKALTAGAALQRAAAMRASGTATRSVMAGSASASAMGADARAKSSAGAAGGAAGSGELISAVAITMVRDAYAALSPGAPMLSTDIIRAAIQTKGLPNAKNMKDILEVVTLAALRTESMRWDFSALDFHSNANTTPASMASGFATMWSDPGLGGASVPPIASPYSMGSVPASAVELVTSQSSLDRSGAIYEAGALRSAGARLDTQYGYLGDETTKSVLWKQTLSAGLVSDDLSKELSGLGF